MGPEPNKTRISIIVEDAALQDYMVLILIGEDYDVKAYSSQDQALKNLEKSPVDLIIVDYHSRNIECLDICKVLRKNFLFRNIPIICIVSDSEPLDKAKLIYAGADDYIQKSSIESDMLIKIKLNIYRKSREEDINPLTLLPGQFNLCRELQKRIDSKDVFAACSADLYQLKYFNQRYGFKKGDEVIQYTAALILKTLKEMGSPSDFLSHPQNDDFFFLTLDDSAEAIADKIIKTFDANIPGFYNSEDTKRGHLLIKNRKGDIEQTPFLRIHFGIVTNENYQFVNPAQIIQIAAELSDFSKKNYEKSCFVKERRKNYPFY